MITRRRFGVLAVGSVALLSGCAVLPFPILPSPANRAGRTPDQPDTAPEAAPAITTRDRETVEIIKRFGSTIRLLWVTPSGIQVTDRSGKSFEQTLTGWRELPGGPAHPYSGGTAPFATDAFEVGVLRFLLIKHRNAAGITVQADPKPIADVYGSPSYNTPVDATYLPPNVPVPHFRIESEDEVQSVLNEIKQKAPAQITKFEVAFDGKNGHYMTVKGTHEQAPTEWTRLETRPVDMTEDAVPPLSDPFDISVIKPAVIFDLFDALAAAIGGEAERVAVSATVFRGKPRWEGTASVEPGSDRPAPHLVLAYADIDGSNLKFQN